MAQATTGAGPAGLGLEQMVKMFQTVLGMCQQSEDAREPSLVGRWCVFLALKRTRMPGRRRCNTSRSNTHKTTNRAHNMEAGREWKYRCQCPQQRSRLHHQVECCGQLSSSLWRVGVGQRLVSVMLISCMTGATATTLHLPIHWQSLQISLRCERSQGAQRCAEWAEG